MELPDDQVRDILRVLVARVDALPPTMPAFARVEAERRIEEEVRRAFAGLPHRLDDPAFLASLKVEPPTPAEEAYVAALARGEIAPAMAEPEPAPVRKVPAIIRPQPVALEPERSAQAAPKSAQAARQEPPGEPRKPRGRATLRATDPDGFLAWAGRYLDRRVEGYLCEEPDEAPDPEVGKSFRGASLGNYKAAIRLWADALGNKRPRVTRHRMRASS